MVNTSGGGVGGMSDLSGVSNLMPGSWTSGIADTINNTMAGWFPSTFASTSVVSSAANAGVMSATGGAADVAGLKAAEAASSLGGNTTFLSTVSPYLMAGGLGSLGYTMLGGALGLPQSKYSGLTAGLGGAAGWGLGSLAAGSFASIGATMGSVVPVVGTIIGALAGGALGSLFGQERKTHPSVYGHMMGQGYTTDTQAYIDAFMNQATYDRAGKTEASAYAQVIGEAASQTAGNILNLAAMLPDEYKKNVEDQLESATWSAGRGFSGASWNIQNWKEGMAEKDLQEAIGDMFEQMGYGANKAFAEAGIGDLFDSFDLSTEEGFKKAQTAISAISSITTAIDEIKAPTSEAEQQAKAFVAQMDALGEAVKASGLNAAYADEMLSDYRTAYVDNYVNSLEEMFNPLSQIEQQAKGYKEAIDGYVAALTTMGASEAQLAQVRGYTQDAIDNITGSLDAAFFPLSEVETQTKATMESLLAYKSALETLGASAEELTRIDAAWGKMQSDLLDKARAYVSTTPEVVTQTNAMNAEFDALRKAMELAGNATADLTELEETRAQAVAALQAQYAESFRQTYADAQVSDAQKQIDTLQAQLEAENAQYSILVSQLSAQQAALSALNGQTQTLASIQAQIAKLKTEINITIDGKNVASSTVGNAQGDYDDAKDHVDQTKPVVGIYGSKYLTEYDLLVAKVASLNATKVDGRTDWTVADARKSMLDWYGSIEGWYKDAGKREGFERGGLATPGGPKMFGERGIEYGDVEQPTRIYDATKTRLMLEGGHEYAQEAYKGMSEFSRMLARTSGARGDGNKEETAALRKEVRELRGMLKAMLTSVVKNTKDVRDFLEEFEETGLPPQRVNA